MTYTAKQLVLVACGGTTGQLWVYESPDSAATVAGAGYISDSADRGMRIGDMLIIRQFTDANKTAITAQSIYTMTAIANGLSAASAVDAGTSKLVDNAGAAPTASSDVAHGYLVGSNYVDTTNTLREPYVCTTNATGAAVWQSMANDIVMSVIGTATLTSAGQTLARLVAPFAGRLTGFRAIVTTACTGASNKLVRIVISGVTVTSGSLTLNHGDAIGTKYSAAALTTANALLAGNTITIQTGAQKTATGVFNMFVICRKQIGANG
jgi:hypothetical protein